MAAPSSIDREPDDRDCGRVMIFVHDLRASGVVRNTLGIARRTARDHQVMLVARNGDGLLAGEAAGEGYELRMLFPQGQPGSLWAAAARLRSLVSEWRPDVLLSSGNRGHAVARLALIGRRLPLRLYRISNSVDRGGLGLRQIAMRVLEKGADSLFLVGAATASSRAFAAALADGRARAIPNGVDQERARALATAPPPAGYPGDDLPMILSVGRLAPQKDFPTLTRAAAIAARQMPLRLVIVGKGPETALDELRRVAAESGLDENRFRLAGETDNVFAWLARAAVFVLPSRWEGSSMALLEALALDVPVVATREAGDAAQVLADGRFGLLVDAGDADAMAEAILRQLSPAAVRPGERVRNYGVEQTLDLYADGIAQAVERARRQGEL